MATNQRFFPGDKLTVPVPSGTVSGTPVMVGSLPGVAVTDRDDNGEATVWFDGVWDLTVTGATTVGLAVYMVDGALTVTQGETGVLFGYALAVKAADAALTPVKIARA